MSGRSPPGVSRRSLLAAWGTGLVALAGCSGLGVGGSDERAYDVGRLSDVAAADAPTRPDAFPVTITGELLDRHYDRAEELVSAVPERPTVPNDVVARRLREERARVVEALEGTRTGGARSDGDRDDDETGLGQLASARHVRADAADVDGAYRASTGGIDREAITGREETLRADLRSFEAEWAYRGDAPERALAVHAELEGLRRDVRRDAEAWPPIPADPATDPFQVGERVRDLESGQATLADADRIRTSYLEGTDEPQSFRAAISAAVHRLQDRVRWERRWVDGYVDPESGDHPFDRSLSNTPAESLYRRARIHANAHVDRGRRTQRAGDHASAALAYARGLASVATLEDVVDVIQAGEYGSPEDVEVVATAHEEAVTAVEAMLETQPIPVTVDVGFPATEALESGRYYLERADGDGHGVHKALGEFGFAGLYADAVPSAVEAVLDALEEER